METNNKLREALERCANWGEQIDCLLGSSDETVYAFRVERSLAHNISECARAALAAPATAEKSSAVGDAAKLREALEELVANIEMRSSTFGLNVMVDTKTYLDAKTALSAPPRNCDRPECATTKAAQEVWRREDGGKTAYYEWLLATAMEKKGGKDAKE